MTPMDHVMDSVDWTPTDAKPGSEGLPYATHSGVLEIMGATLRCYRLNDGRAIFDADDVHALFGDVIGPAQGSIPA